MKLRSFSIEDLIAAGNAAVYVFKDKLGYDNANFEGININDYNVSLEFDLTDDFQNNLVSGEKYMAGYYVKISLDEGDPCQVFYNRLHSWPTRAQRELHIMASQLS